MYLCAKCRLSVSFVHTVHRSNNKVGGDKDKGERNKRKEFGFILPVCASLFVKERHTIFLLAVFFQPQSYIIVLTAESNFSCT